VLIINHHFRGFSNQYGLYFSCRTLTNKKKNVKINIIKKGIEMLSSKYRTYTNNPDEQRIVTTSEVLQTELGSLFEFICNNFSKVVCFSLIIAVFIWMNSTTKSQLAMQNIDYYYEPEQKSLNKEDIDTLSTTVKIDSLDIGIIPIATYKLNGKILSKKKYYNSVAKLVPMDVVIGWGDFLSGHAAKQLKVKQSDRTYQIKSNNLNFGDPIIKRMTGNNHIIPANANIRKGFEVARKYDDIYIEGYLVNLSISYTASENIKDWSTSTTREDSGKNAGEIIYVTKLITSRGTY